MLNAHLFMSFATQKRKIISEGTPMGFEALLVAFCYFLPLKSKRRKPLGFQERVFLIFHYNVSYFLTLIFTPIKDDGSE